MQNAAFTSIDLLQHREIWQ